MIGYALLYGMVKSLLVTEGIELALALLFLKWKKQEIFHDLLVVFLVNLLTNPIVVYLDFWLHYHFITPLVWVITIETIVWFVEAWIYRKTLYTQQNPLLLSLVLNCASYGIGYFL